MTPAFHHHAIIHDAANGLILPSFFGLAMSPMVPEVVTYLDRHALTLAGVIGVVYVIREMISE